MLAVCAYRLHSIGRESPGGFEWVVGVCLHGFQCVVGLLAYGWASHH